ncbi:MAG: hypothetical protein PG981_000474 [Wolbachia endosymbiont of Ctenocephalides orientis wCori]|nr:MAG: hypothetical protein PG981_000474 [Wolbachia endosymbiont of Ctenocephalides orientis wCori]
MDPIVETVDNAIPKERISNSSENESNSQDLWSTLEELEDKLPDELRPCKNQQSNKRKSATAILDEFHAKEYRLEGVSVEPATNRQRDS